MSSTAFFYDLKACAFFVSEAPLLYKCDICSGKADIVKDETNKSGIIEYNSAGNMLSNGFVSKYLRSVVDIEYTIDCFVLH